MSHRCGAGCYRKQNRRAECPYCKSYQEQRRKTVPAPDAPGGRVTISVHWKRDKPHPEVPLKDVAYGLANWRIRGTATDELGRQSIRHYAFVPDHGKVIRAAVSMDGKRFITAFIDSDATDHWHRGTQDYFSQEVADMETRDEPDRRL